MADSPRRTKQGDSLRHFIIEVDGRYVVTPGWDLIRVLLVEDRPNNDGGTGSHRVYVCLAAENDEAKVVS